MTEPTSDLPRLQAAMTAKNTVRAWSEGLEQFELFRAVHDAGWLEHLGKPTTAELLAGTVAVPVKQVATVLSILAASGVVQADEGSRYSLTPEFEALLADDTGVTLIPSLEGVDLARDAVRRAVVPPDQRTGLSGVQALSVARNTGLAPTDAARELYSVLYGAIPEYRERLAEGGPLLDVGCGVGGALLTTLTLFEDLHAVGIELVPEVAEETRARAKEAGVDGRVEVRAVDARDLADKSEFTAAFWAQPFFTAEARPAVLAAILRALKPGGLLVVQELFPPTAEGTQEPLRSQLDRLFFEQRNAVFAMSAEDMAAEAAVVGFALGRIIESPLGRLILMRKPD